MLPIRNQREMLWNFLIVDIYDFPLFDWLGPNQVVKGLPHFDFGFGNLVLEVDPLFVNGEVRLEGNIEHSLNSDSSRNWFQAPPMMMWPGYSSLKHLFSNLALIGESEAAFFDSLRQVNGKQDEAAQELYNGILIEVHVFEGHHPL